MIRGQNRREGQIRVCDRRYGLLLVGGWAIRAGGGR